MKSTKHKIYHVVNTQYLAAICIISIKLKGSQSYIKSGEDAFEQAQKFRLQCSVTDN